MKMPPEADRTVGLDEKAAEGGYPSAVPIGHQNERDELRAELSRNEQVIPHEEFLAAARHSIDSSNAPRICTLRKNPAKRQDSSKPSCRTTRSRTEVSP